MTETTGAIRFDLLLVDGFVLTEYAGVVDQLRLANRVMLSSVFQWRPLSVLGGPVACRSGALVNTTPVETYPEAEYVVVLGNTNPLEPGLSWGRVIDTYVSRGSKVILLSEAAARYIEDRGDDGLTTHWENRALLEEQSGLSGTVQALATEKGQIITCAGMGATVDMTLTIMMRHIPHPTVAAVADILLHDRIRDLGTLQPFGGSTSTQTGDRELDQCIELMQANIEDPLPIGDLVRLVGVSSRSLERRFHSHLQARPADYYRTLRLHKANNLLLNTTMPVNEIGLACGFPSGFTRHYRAMFGLTPQEARRRRKIRRAKETPR